MTLTKEEVERVVAAYPTYQGKATEAANELPFSQPTITKYWEEAGLGTKKVKRRLRKDGRAVHSISEEKISRITAAHETYKGNLVDATANLPFARSSIKKYWGEAGLKITYRKRGLRKDGKPSLALRDEQIVQIVEAHETYNGVISAAAEASGVSHTTVRKYWDIENLETRTKRKNPTVNFSPVTPDELTKIIAAYQTYKGNVSKASKHLGRSRPTITKHWREADLLIARPGGQISLEERVG